MSATTLGVVVQMTSDTYIRPSHTWPGISSGSLELVGDVGAPAGVSLSFTSAAAVQRLLDAGQVLLGQMLREQHRAEQEEAWLLRAAQTGRPPLHAVTPAEVEALSATIARHPSMSGSPA